MSLRLSPELYEEMKQRIFERDEFKCRYCGSRNNLHAHHIVYRSEQGTDTASNLVTLCVFCHDGVHQGKLCIWAEDQFVGADGPLEFITALGWRPGQ